MRWFRRHGRILEKRIMPLHYTEYKNMSRKTIYYRVAGIFVILFLSILICEIGIDKKDMYKEEDSSLRINEVCTSNVSCLYNEEADTYSDWIEIYNMSDQAQNLSGYTLFKGTNKDRFVFGDRMIGPHEYVVIYCDGIEDDQYSHASFKLSSKGVELFLTNAKGTPIDRVTVPALSYNETYARVRDGKGDWEIATPTPLSSNDEAKEITKTTLKKPVFSLESGFYEVGTKVEITAKDDQKIYYTTDGSIPTVESACYQQAIELVDRSPMGNIYNAVKNITTHPEKVDLLKDAVDKATVLRAIAVDATGKVSDIQSCVFFVGFEDKQYKDASIVSLVVDPDDFFGENGIYVIPNCEQSGREYEVEATLSVFNESGNIVGSQQVGISLYGKTSRDWLRKCFVLDARKAYSKSHYFSFDMLDTGEQIHQVVLLKNFDRIMTAKQQEMEQKMEPYGKKCYVFLNGEFWDTYYMLEKR